MIGALLTLGLGDFASSSYLVTLGLGDYGGGGSSDGGSITLCMSAIQVGQVGFIAGSVGLCGFSAQEVGLIGFVDSQAGCC